jgi:hypothetical protein
MCRVVFFAERHCVSFSLKKGTMVLMNILLSVDEKKERFFLLLLQKKWSSKPPIPYTKTIEEATQYLISKKQWCGHLRMNALQQHLPLEMTTQKRYF